MSKKIVDIPALKLYARKGYNVLLSGKHGVGKTAIVSEVFNSVFGPAHVNWRYFSASTLDPFVDFIGIPNTVKDETGKDIFRIIPPEGFTGDEKIEAIFLDEINRADSKVLNAVMELVQFRRINGREFPHLKVVWAAENPADTEDDYMVLPLDPAQKDRFHVQLDLPYDVDEKYFNTKYDPDVVEIAVAWWRDKARNAKVKMISPRKLDHILDAYTNGMDIAHFTNEMNLSELKDNLKGIAIAEDMKKAVDSGDQDRIRSKFTTNNIKTTATTFSRERNRAYLQKAYPHLGEEIQDFIQVNFTFMKAPLNLEGKLTENPSHFSEKKFEQFLDSRVTGHSSIHVFADELRELGEMFCGEDLKVEIPKLKNKYGLTQLFSYKFDPKGFTTPQFEKLVEYFGDHVGLDTQRVMTGLLVASYALAINGDVAEAPENFDLMVFLKKAAKSSKFKDFAKGKVMSQALYIQNGMAINIQKGIANTKEAKDKIDGFIKLGLAP